MRGIKNDYRVSTIVVLCKDCNEDVGLYPARHQCKKVVKKPELPTLVSSTQSSYKTWINSLSPTSSSFNEPTNNKKLNSKLWDKIMNVTMSISSSNDNNDCPDSDDDDWEGETHVSRILREYYEKNNKSLPIWLFDDEHTRTLTSTGQFRKSRRLWQQDVEADLTPRQKEIIELRKSNNANINITSSTQNSSINDKDSRHQYYNSDSQSMTRSQSERKHLTNVSLSMNDHLKHLYPKRTNTSPSKYQYVSTSNKNYI